MEKNIRQDPGALAELRELGALATPTIRIGDEVIVGFDRERLIQALGLDA